MKLCILLLTCANNEEADQISRSLLEKRLIFCAKKSSVSSSFLWKGKIDSASEVLLIMDSRQEYFDRVEKVVRKIHSYNTFTLFSLPIAKTTQKVEKWIREESTTVL